MIDDTEVCVKNSHVSKCYLNFGNLMEHDSMSQVPIILPVQGWLLQVILFYKIYRLGTKWIEISFLNIIRDDTDAI